jgi:flagellar FliL protein
VADKPEAKEPEADAPPAALTAPGAGSGGGAMAWIPAIAAILIAPVVSFAVAQFVLVPRFQKKLAGTTVVAEAGSSSAPAAESSPAPSGGKEGAEGKGGASNSYDFANVVVNLSGTMGTRYLKTSFTVTGPEKDMKATFEANKPRLTDVTLNVLSALSLSELEEPGSKNVLRGKLVTAYNQAIGHHAVDQVYFSDFLIQ